MDHLKSIVPVPIAFDSDKFFLCLSGYSCQLDRNMTIINNKEFIKLQDLGVQKSSL